MSLGRMFLNKINHNRVLFTIMRENLQFSFIVLFWATDCTFLVLLMVSAAPSWGPRTSARRRRWRCATLGRRSGSSAPSCLRWKSFAPSWRRRQSSDTSTPELTPPRCWPTGSSIISKVFLLFSRAAYWYVMMSWDMMTWWLTFILTQWRLEVLVGYTIFWIVKMSRGRVPVVFTSCAGSLQAPASVLWPNAINNTAIHRPSSQVYL